MDDCKAVAAKANAINPNEFCYSLCAECLIIITFMYDSNITNTITNAWPHLYSSKFLAYCSIAA